MDSTVNNHGWIQLMSVCQLMPDPVFRALVIQSLCNKTGLCQFHILCKPHFVFKTHLRKNTKK